MPRPWPETNRQVYALLEIVNYYSAQQGLFPAEEAILKMVSQEISGGTLLDVGVGGGRTTDHLRRISQNYVGIDYSEEMVERTRSRFPGADIRHMDARRLDVFKEASFDFILFSFNGLDSVNHDDRRTVLSGLARALKASGWFAFSTHNLASLKLSRPRLKRPSFRTGPRACLSELRELAFATFNHVRHARHERQGEGYAIVNDAAHRCSLLTYYVSIREQLNQLRGAGFSGEIVCFDQMGRQATADSDSPWIHFLVQKSSVRRCPQS